MSSLSTPTSTEKDASKDVEEDPTQQLFLNPLYAPRWRLLRLIITKDLVLVDAICSIIQATEFDDVSKALVGIFESNGDAQRLLQWAIKSEVMCTESEATLFRGVSVASKLVSSYFKLKGVNYLKKVLHILLREVVQNGSHLEVDPTKIDKNDTLKANQERLMFHTKVIFDTLCKSTNECPYPIRQVFRIAQEEVSQRFPDMKQKVVGGFFFLRFLCPSMVTPEGYGLIEEVPSPKARRSLILVSKILQNLANQVEFGNKEEYMCIMNGFITGNMVQMNNLLDILANPPDVPPLNYHPSPSKDMPPFCLDTLYTQISFIKDKIGRAWACGPPLPSKNKTPTATTSNTPTNSNNNSNNSTPTDKKPNTLQTSSQSPSPILSRATLFKRLELALKYFPHKSKKSTEDAMDPELRAVHKEIKAKVQLMLVERQNKLKQTQNQTPTPTPTPTSSQNPPTRITASISSLKLTTSPESAPKLTTSTNTIEPSSSTSTGSCSSSTTPQPEEDKELASMLEEVVNLKEVLEKERKIARELEEKVITAERKLEKEVEMRFQREYKLRIQDFKEMFESLKNYKSVLLSRPDLAAEFKNLRNLPSMTNSPPPSTTLPSNLPEK
eukprot:TRINITY_DN3958_c0_g1_i1.p1 TRINITY_DN3958_c0_g1~~TRINITY_DN3958_c0_g1_i1.p1  ORF type:complete len:612 (+),score=150.03 TRINITY_DN3958_c0_g1_i1:172-2007(+)